MKWLKDYFDLSRKEEVGFIALLSIIAFLFALQFFIIYFIPAKKTDFSNLQKIAGQLQSGITDSIKPDSVKSTEFRGPKKTLTIPVDLNTADSIKLMTIKGIGSTFAGRILAFRRRLGCFTDVSQLMDVQGIRSEKYGYLKPQVCLSKGHPNYLHINSATIAELTANPYFSYDMAKAVIDYRTKHGRFGSVAELKIVLASDENTFQKLEPYITL